MTLPVISEEVEQRMVVKFCQFKGYPLFHVPNSTYTRSWQTKRRNADLGVSAGVPDLFVIVNCKLIAIEMKRAKGGRVSPEQKNWLDRLNKAGITARVCNGADEAIEFIQSFIKDENKGEPRK